MWQTDIRELKPAVNTTDIRYLMELWRVHGLAEFSLSLGQLSSLRQQRYQSLLYLGIRKHRDHRFTGDGHRQVD